MAFITDLFLQLTELATGAETQQQIGVLLLAGAIPFIESYLGSFLGVLVGIPPALAITASVIGNAASTFLPIAIASRARNAATRNRQRPDAQQSSGRRQKVAKYLDRFGVPGVCLLGPIVVASQITAPTLIALGATKRSVYLFQGISIIAWGIAFGFFGDVVASWML